MCTCAPMYAHQLLWECVQWLLKDVCQFTRWVCRYTLILSTHTRRTPQMRHHERVYHIVASKSTKVSTVKLVVQLAMRPPAFPDSVWEMRRSRPTTQQDGGRGYTALWEPSPNFIRSPKNSLGAMQMHSKSAMTIRSYQSLPSSSRYVGWKSGVAR